jgi:hypothetical protein
VSDETTSGRIERRIDELDNDWDFNVEQRIILSIVIGEEIDRLEARYESHIHHLQNQHHTRLPVEPK